MKKKTKFGLIAAAVGVTVSVGWAVGLLLRPTTPILGIFLLMLGAVVVLAIIAFSGRKAPESRSELQELREKVKTLDRELAEKTQTKLNIVSLNPILHVATMNVDTSFVRPYVREQDDMTFHGALRADICAEYGIRLEEVLFRYDADAGLLNVASFHPGIIAYSKKQLSWAFASSYRARQIFGYELSSVCDSQTEAFTKSLCDELRVDLEKEIDERKVEELAWLSPLVTEQVKDVLRVMMGREDLIINILPGDKPRELLCAEGFVTLPVLREQLNAPERLASATPLAIEAEAIPQS